MHWRSICSVRQQRGAWSGESAVPVERACLSIEINRFIVPAWSPPAAEHDGQRHQDAQRWPDVVEANRRGIGFPSGRCHDVEKAEEAPAPDNCRRGMASRPRTCDVHGMARFARDANLARRRCIEGANAVATGYTIERGHHHGLAVNTAVAW